MTALLKVDGEVGKQKNVRPTRFNLKKAETGMKERVIVAVKDLRGEGTTLGV